MQFPTCQTLEHPLGLYPLVNRAADLRPLFAAGVDTVQIRIKDLHGEALEAELAEADRLAKQANARLFINDYWQNALALNAYGVHLGQEDLEALAPADLEALHQSGLRLGISTHTPDEIDLALRIQPSYIAIGPVFETQSKVVNYATTGLDNLKAWRQRVDYPVVAIGGIDADNLGQVVQAGADGIAMISGIHQDGFELHESLRLLKEQFDEAFLNHEDTKTRRLENFNHKNQIKHSTNPSD